MFFERYWSHIQAFQNNIRRIFSGARLFPQNQQSRCPRCWDFRASYSWNMNLYLFLIHLESFYLVSPKLKSWSCPLGPKIMTMRFFGVFLKGNRKVTSPRWSKIEAFGPLLNTNCSKNDPPDPHTWFFPDFPQSPSNMQDMRLKSA